MSLNGAKALPVSVCLHCTFHSLSKNEATYLEKKTCGAPGKARSSVSRCKSAASSLMSFKQRTDEEQTQRASEVSAFSHRDSLRLVLVQFICLNSNVLEKSCGVSV